MALLALITAALYGTYFGLVSSRDAVTSGMEARRELRTTLDSLRRELSSLLCNNRSNKRLHFVVEDRDFFGKPASTLDLTTLSGPRAGNLPSSDQVAVKYNTIEKDGAIVLTRQVRELYATNTPDPYPQMEKIEGFLVECYDGGKWVRSWNTDINYSIPKAVRVTVMIKEGGKSVGFSTIASPRISGS